MIYRYEEIVHSTERAILFKFKEGKCWVPMAMMPGINERDNKVEIYDNFKFKYIDEQPVEDLFEEIEPEPVVKKIKKKVKKMKKKFKKGKHKIIPTIDNPLGLDLDIYYTDGTRKDEIPF